MITLFSVALRSSSASDDPRHQALGLPAVTAYLIAGVLIGPRWPGRLGELSGLTSMEQMEKLSLSNVALGFIAFAIGNEFRLVAEGDGPSGHDRGHRAGIGGAVCGYCADCAALHSGGDKLSIPAAITLGAIATATAPVATLMVVRQYKAGGQADRHPAACRRADDAVGLVVFAVFGIARAIHSGAVELTSIRWSRRWRSLACAGRAAMGWILTQLEKLFNPIPTARR